MSYNYRFSIIPAAAILDERLTPRALKLLCLLGRHTDDNGWCSRSQVRIARELKWARATVYDAFELLYDAGWVERRRNGRGKTGPEVSDQPFASYSYRVRLDLDDAPSPLPDTRESERDDDLASASGEGSPAVEPASPNASADAPSSVSALPSECAAPVGGGAALAAGGAAARSGRGVPPLGAAPLEGPLEEPTPQEPEREMRARARDLAGKRLSALKAVWPTAALDDQQRIDRAWAGLEPAEHKLADERAAAFLEALKRHKRSAVPALWRYLEEKRWALMPEADKPAPAAATRATIALGSEESRAWAAACSVAFGGEAKLPYFWLAKGKPEATVRARWPLGGAHWLKRMDDWVFVERGTPQFSRWAERTAEIFDRAPVLRQAERAEHELFARAGARWGDRVMVGILVPSEWPPARGSPDAGAGATGPPDAAPAPSHSPATATA